MTPKVEDYIDTTCVASTGGKMPIFVEQSAKDC